MKKYVKPELFYEKFELTQHIADCAWELNSAAKESCEALADPDYLPDFPPLFMSNTYGCMLISGETYQDYCYHDGAQGVNVFKS